MGRFVKLPSMVVLTVCVLLFEATYAPAQTGYSLTTNTTINSPNAPDGGGVPNNTISSGSWGTPIGDSVSTITIYWSTDNINFNAVPVPAANISGVGLTSGSFFVTYNLAKGNYYIYGQMITSNGVKVKSSTQYFMHP